MKKLILPALLISLAWGCNQQQTAHYDGIVSEEVQMKGNTYGEAFEEKNILSLAQLEDEVKGKDSIQAVVTGEIVASCQSKGCWMDVKLADNSTMKVTFTDYGFFLPVEDLTGKTVVFAGTAKREVTSVEDQRHYAEDAGKSKEEINAITTPKEELRFVADGVIVK